MFKKIIKKFNMFKELKIDRNNDCNIAYSWIWEFSKKVVVAIFLIYVLNYILCWSASFLCGLKGLNIPYIDTFITSTNETTQIVLGGYFVKAMAENVIKEKKIKFNNKNNVTNNDESYSDDE